VTRESVALNVERGAISASATGAANSPSRQALAAPREKQRRRGSRKGDMAGPEAVGSARQSTNAVAGLSPLAWARTCSL
jgi:hypothetical protein